MNITRQSPDIAQGVDGDGDKKLGAGDQGMMFGYATSETMRCCRFRMYWRARLWIVCVIAAPAVYSLMQMSGDL